MKIVKLSNPYRVVFDIFHPVCNQWINDCVCEYDDLCGVCDEIYKNFNGFRVDLLLVDTIKDRKSADFVLFRKTIAEVVGCI